MKSGRQQHKSIAAGSSNEGASAAKTASGISSNAKISSQATAPSSNSNAKSNKLKRRAPSTVQTVDLSVDDSSDEESLPLQKNCIASRTRSKFHIESPLPNKRSKSVTETSTSASAAASATFVGQTSSESTRGSIVSDPSSPLAATTNSSSSSSSSLLRRSSRSRGHQTAHVPASIGFTEAESGIRRGRIQVASTTGSCVSSAASTSQACASHQVREVAGANASIGSTLTEANATSATATAFNNNKASNVKHPSNQSTSVSAHQPLEPSTSHSVMANDGSRDSNPHELHQQSNQSHYGTPSLSLRFSSAPTPKSHRSKHHFDFLYHFRFQVSIYVAVHEAA